MQCGRTNVLKYNVAKYEKTLSLLDDGKSFKAVKMEAGRMIIISKIIMIILESQRERSLGVLCGKFIVLSGCHSEGKPTWRWGQLAPPPPSAGARLEECV